jgi:sugar lactone lactonase YvrE
MRRALALALVLVGIAGSAPVPPRPIVARAPFEVVADGFGSPRGLVLDGEDRLYVADRDAGTVTRIDAEGRRVIARRLERPVGVAVDLQGRVLVAEERGARVVRLDPGGPTPIVRGVKQPRWLAVSERGTVYLSARRPTRDSDPEPDDESAEPEVILALSAEGGLSVFAQGFQRLQGLATGADAVYAATTGLQGPPHEGGIVYRIPVLADGTAGAVTALTPRDLFERPIGLALDRLGGLYLTTSAAMLRGQRSRDAVVKVRPDGVLATFAAYLGDPRGLALDSRGHLYVADGAAGRVMRFLAPTAPAVDPGPAFVSRPLATISGSTAPTARVDVFRADGAVTIATTSTATGRFSTAIPVTPNAENRLEVFATGERGNGLASAPAEAIVQHDARAPGLALQTPPAGAVVRDRVQVRAHASDVGSGLAVLGVRAAGGGLEGTVVPSLPSPAATVTTAWDTASVPDGAQTLSATAADRAGNVATIERVVIVDNTPPDTQITGGPDGPLAQPTATLTFTGHDNLTPTSGLQFAWRLDDGPLSAFTAETTVTLVDLAPGPHVFDVRARDLAGNEDPTPARRTLVVDSRAVTITIASPVTGASVPAGTVLVRGTIGGGTSTGVSVNGMAALVHGVEWAAEIPVIAGTNVIAAVARAASGGESTAVISVTGTGPTAGISLRAEPASGVAPLEVIWHVASRAPRPIVSYELDAQGNGAFAAPVATLDGARSLYPTPGLRFPVVRAIDDQGHVYTAVTIVQADEAQAAAARFAALWSAFRARLQAVDRAGALAHLSPTLRARFEPILQQLEPDLATVAASLGSIELIDQVDNLAEAAIVQTEDGSPRLYFVYFRRDTRGQWLIQEM